MKGRFFAAFLCCAFMCVQAAAEEPKQQQPPRAAEKDWCLLDTSRCQGGDYQLLEKIQRLQRALAQGTEVYTPGELKSLRLRLQEAEEYYELLTG